MKHYINYILLFLCFICFSCGAERNIKKGDKLFAIGEYYDAAEQYRQGYAKIPAKDRSLRGQTASKMAFCYQKINFTQKAISAYNYSMRYNQQLNISQRTNYAQQLLKAGNYKEAIKEFKAILDTLPQNTIAQNGLQSAQQAIKEKEIGSKYIVKRMDVFNSRRSDYCPMFLGNEINRLYFSSTRNEAMGDDTNGITGTKNGDIFVSEKNDKGVWSKPEPVVGGLNTAYDEGACCFSPDLRTMYLTQCASDPSYPRYAQIMTSNRSDASWSKANQLKITNDTLSTFAHPAISPDGNWLYFVSDMPGGKGGLDIWRAQLTSSGIASIENLGEPINTEGDEMFPSFRPNGDLYFSSNGHVGLGGLDIFIAAINQNGQYELQHPNYPLNTSADEFGITFETVHNRGFFSSNRNDARGYDHIYSFEYPEIIQTIKGWVYEVDGYELPASQVYVIGDDGTNKRLIVKSDGSFTITVNPGVKYLILASCKGFLNHTEEIEIPNSSESKEHVLQFPLASITAPVLIDNIFYDFDKATLRPESTTSLDELVKLLNENPNVTIELSAHTDYRGGEEYNKKLSQKRAEAVVNYLIAHGIASDRLTPVGYGKEKPKKIKKKLTEKYPWLKEDTALTESFIQSLDKEKQEICNQLNRRTEFIVLRTTYGMFDEKGHIKSIPKKQETKKSTSTTEEPNIFFE